jgi:hypothetical protein
LYISHLLFVDDILIFCDGSRRDTDKLFEGITLFKRATGMLINDQKSSITFASLEAADLRYILSQLPFQVLELEEGLKYLGFSVKTK